MINNEIITLWCAHRNEFKQNVKAIVKLYETNLLNSGVSTVTAEFHWSQEIDVRCPLANGYFLFGYSFSFVRN